MSRARTKAMTVALALSSSLGLAACTSHVTLAPAELPALANASPGPSGPFPTITTKDGARKVVYGQLETVTVLRKDAASLVYPAPIRAAALGDRLVVRTRDDQREIPLAEITEVRASYDDYLVRDRVAGGVLVGTGMPIFVSGVVMGALGLTNKELSGGAGAARPRHVVPRRRVPVRGLHRAIHPRARLTPARAFRTRPGSRPARWTR